MVKENRLLKVAPIVKNYALEPHFVEERGRIRKIYTNKGVFALKKIDPKHGQEGILLNNLVAGYTHIHFSSAPELVQRWVEQCIHQRRKFFLH